MEEIDILRQALEESEERERNADIVFQQKILELERRLALERKLYEKGARNPASVVPLIDMTGIDPEDEAAIDAQIETVRRGSPYLFRPAELDFAAGLGMGLAGSPLAGQPASDPAADETLRRIVFGR